MKKIVLLVLFILFIPIVNAKTVLDDYKVEITIDKDDEFKIKESFKTKELGDKKFKRFFSMFDRDYKTNIVGLKPESEEFYGTKNYIDSFELEENKNYYLEYNYKDTKVEKGGIEYYRFSPISNSDTIECNRFTLIVTIKDGREKDVSFNNDNDILKLSKDGNIITGTVEKEKLDSIGFTLKKKVTKMKFNLIVYLKNNILGISYIFQCIIVMIIGVYNYKKKTNKTGKIILYLLVVLSLILYLFPIWTKLVVKTNPIPLPNNDLLYFNLSRSVLSISLILLLLIMPREKKSRFGSLKMISSFLVLIAFLASGYTIYYSQYKVVLIVFVFGGCFTNILSIGWLDMIFEKIREVNDEY